MELLSVEVRGSSSSLADTAFLQLIKDWTKNLAFLPKLIAINVKR